MSEVKRYEYNNFTEQLEEHEQGYYVLHSDYEKLKAQLEKAESVIDFYSDSDNWEHKSPAQADYVVILDDSGTGEFQLNHMTDDDRVGGRRAREYFKEKEQV